jgi:hypothetical protein
LFVEQYREILRTVAATGGAGHHLHLIASATSAGITASTREAIVSATSAPAATTGEATASSRAANKEASAGTASEGAAAASDYSEHNEQEENNEEDDGNPSICISRLTFLFRYGFPTAFIFAFRGGHDSSQALPHHFIVILLAKLRCKFVSDDADTEGVWQRPFQAAPGMDPDFPLLRQKYQDAVVFALLSDLSGSVKTLGIVIENEIGRPIGKDDNQNLIRRLALKIC